MDMQRERHVQQGLIYTIIQQVVVRIQIGYCIHLIISGYCRRIRPTLTMRSVSTRRATSPLHHHVNNGRSVRPVFNLTSDVTIVSGYGTSTSPYQVTKG